MSWPEVILAAVLGSCAIFWIGVVVVVVIIARSVGHDRSGR